MTVDILKWYMILGMINVFVRTNGKKGNHYAFNSIKSHGIQSCQDIFNLMSYLLFSYLSLEQVSYDGPPFTDDDLHTEELMMYLRV